MRRPDPHWFVTYPLSMLWMTVSLLPSTLRAEEECLYDQAAQHEQYVELTKKYPDSRYLEKENKIVISGKNQEVHLRIGGCVHYGVSIQLHKAGVPNDWTQEKLFQQVAGLLELYGQEMVNQAEFWRVVENERWTDLSDDNGMYYFLGYPGYTAFEVYQRTEGNEVIVGVSFYN